ncbi:hypothetical protein SKAU_G00370060 [Synaphobranchus kaupii]|uniref:Uncharacterized protein n=1 Tax=Synaphobranchus kaupii TaxID=118154 RepID=A0A9Q1IEW9_SYNKA|nr:hypothetical protein SKAU_G00370060 [Synaphobranchus kaupii]
MTIGKSSKKSPKSPKYLDLADAFYGRLDETGAERGTDGEVEEQGRGDGRTVELQSQAEQRDGKRESGVFDFNQGMLEDDGTATLLRRSPGRRSSRWRRKSGSKKKRVETEPEDSTPAGESAAPAKAAETMTVLDLTAVQSQEAGHVLVHFSVREEADDQVLICKKAETEAEGQRGEEEMKVAKSGKLKNYRKALDRALRRGWETFVTNLRHRPTFVHFVARSEV